MKNEHDDFVVEWLPLKNGKIMVKTKDREGVDDGGISKKFNSQLCHLGSFILFHSKGLKIDVKLALDGFRNNKISYGDNDTEYINNYYQILKNQKVSLQRISIKQKTNMAREPFYMDFSSSSI